MVPPPAGHLDSPPKETGTFAVLTTRGRSKVDRQLYRSITRRPHDDHRCEGFFVFGRGRNGLERDTIVHIRMAPRW